MSTGLADCVTATIRSEVRCKVGKMLLVWLPGLLSTTEAEPMVAESCLVLSCNAPAANAALLKLPVMVMVCGLAAAANVGSAKFAPFVSQGVTAPLQTTPETVNPIGKIFVTVTLMASLGPKLFNVRV